MNHRLRKLMKLTSVSLLMLSTVSMGAPLSEPAPAVRCELSAKAKLFIAKDGTKFIAKIPKGSRVTLKVEHAARWMVETSEGKLGYLDRAWMKKVCRYLPAVNEATSTKATPQLEASDISEAAVALDVAKAAAEGAAIDDAVVKEQAANLSRVAQARDAARAAEGLIAPSVLIRVAVYDLELSNISDGLGNATTEALLQEVRKLEGVSAIGMDEVREMLDFEAQRQAMGCDADDECLAEIAGALGVDEILTGKLSEEADGRMMVLKRIDQRRAQIRTTFDKRLNIGNGEEFLLSVGDAIAALFEERQNRPGTTRGVSKKTVLRLNPPPIKSWMTYAAYGLTAVAAGLSGYAYTQGIAANERLNALEGDGTSIPKSEWQPEYDAYQSWQTLNQTGAYAAGGLFLSSVVMSFFTDWMGEESTETVDE